VALRPRSDGLPADISDRESYKRDHSRLSRIVGNAKEIKTVSGFVLVQK
jgi:hypothetical protein